MAKDKEKAKRAAAKMKPKSVYPSRPVDGYEKSVGDGFGADGKYNISSMGRKDVVGRGSGSAISRMNVTPRVSSYTGDVKGYANTGKIRQMAKPDKPKKK